MIQQSSSHCTNSYFIQHIFIELSRHLGPSPEEGDYLETGYYWLKGYLHMELIDL